MLSMLPILRDSFIDVSICVDIKGHLSKCLKRNIHINGTYYDELDGECIAAVVRGVSVFASVCV